MSTDNIHNGQYHTIGIVGGMGPEAGLTLFNSILNNTTAHTDQEHIPVVMISFPAHIPDRTEFLEGRTAVNPAYAVAKIIKRLEAAGAGIVGMACNTMYAPGIFQELTHELERLSCKVKLLHMPLETCLYVQAQYPLAARIGLLATNGTYKYGEYKNILEKQGYEVVMPNSKIQTEVIHRMIYDRRFGIKANPGTITGVALGLMKQAIHFFKEEQTDLIILGCTELSTMMNGNKLAEGMATVSSVEALALALIREASNSQKHQPALRIEI